MGGRSTRRSQTEPDFSSLTKLDSLILAQSVYELGASAWPAVAKVLSKHPLLSHPKSFFTAQSCQAMYKHMRNEAFLDITDADSERHSPSNLKLAQIHYQARILELQSLISEEEEKFKKLVSEIEELKSHRSVPTIEAKEDVEVEDFTSDLSGISSISSPGKVDPDEPANKDSTPSPSEKFNSDTTTELEPVPMDGLEVSTDVTSPQLVEKDLLKAEPEDEEVPVGEKEGKEVSVGFQEGKEVFHDSKDDIEEVETLATPIAGNEAKDDETPQPTSIADADADVNPSATPAADAENEASRAVTPHESIADTEPDRMEVVDEEGVTSSDEPAGLHKARLVKAAKRQRKAGTPMQTRKTRRLRRTSGATEVILEVSEPMAEEDKVQTPRTMEEEEASPAPEPTSLKRQSKRRASLTDDNPREIRRLRADSEPAEDDDGPGPSSSRRRRQDNQASKRFQNVIGMLHSQISAHRNGTIFHNPIKNSEAPDYHEIVKRPMDLKTIKSKIKDGIISNSLEFQRDIYLMFANAMMYNRPGSDVYNMAEDMMLECEGYIQTFRQSEGFVRGTR
ncbi:hypothetical protein GYMLUDRAFT_36932 [Collybiopsis luxurians FD-317 M1]|nr:hypothetical protein GYMLUDRAFT_36932 [Collybiopsis luxurians FD-317 M1]